MRKVIVILGQTATGKSDLAVRIALRLRSGSSTGKFGGEIISADSRQVYIGLDIGSGKITKNEMRGVPHHLLDVIKLKKKFTVAEYQKLAEEKIKDIISRDKTPIICGGTGFYIDAVTKGIVFPDVPPNIKLRKTLEKKSLSSLIKILNKLDKSRARSIDINNKVRIIRAIEIAKALGKVPKITAVKPLYKFIKIGLYLPEDKLKKKINLRLKKRVIGMVNEGRKLRKAGLSFKRMLELGLEYKYIALYLQNKITKIEMQEKLSQEIYQYAKRQMTWFKKDNSITWVDASNKTNLNLKNL